MGGRTTSRPWEKRFGGETGAESGNIKRNIRGGKEEDQQPRACYQFRAMGMSDACNINTFPSQIQAEIRGE